MVDQDLEKYFKGKIEDIQQRANGDPLKAFQEILPMLSDMSSKAASESLRLSMCPVHEVCDGSCHHVRVSDTTNDIHFCADHTACDGDCVPLSLRYQPLAFSSVPMPDIPSPSRPRSNERTTPYDEVWLEAQKREEFSYTPLPPDRAAIRLLRIQPGVFRDDILQCTVEIVYLDENPSYWALSYHWGAPIFDQTIVCDGKLRKVTKNLMEALKGFRQCLDDKVMSDRVWVDAVGIDQSNPAELNSQLRIMQSIYEKAQGVYVHLGEVDHSWYLSFDLMHRVSLIVNYLEGHMRWKFTREELLKNFGFPPVSHPAWSSFISIFASTWFTRTWIIQEITFAKQAIVRYGRFTFWWEILELTWRFMLHNGLLHNAIALNNETVRRAQLGANNMANIVWFRNQRTAGRLKDVPILETMTRAKDFDVSNPRDKIIAILGLLKIQEDVSLDYSLDTKALYAEFAKYLIKQNLGMDMLQFSGLNRRANLSLDIPSWVPDWMAQTLTSTSKHVSRLRPRPYRAGGPWLDGLIINAPVGSPAENKIIAVVRCPVSKIERLSNSACAESSVIAFLPWHDEALEMWEEACSQGFDRYGDTVDAFCRTITVDGLQKEFYTGLAITQPSCSVNEDYCHALEEMRRELAGELTTVDGIAAGPTSHFAFKVQCLTACSGRKFAVLEDGRIGLVPECSKVGDEVAVLMGVAVPFVLRPIGDSNTWQVVGDCYVHGIMDAEILKEKKKETGLARLA